jgi:hypothetical protein
VEGIAFTAAGLPVEFSRTYVRGDRTRYYVERVVVRAGAHVTDREPEPVAVSHQERMPSDAVARPT